MFKADFEWELTAVHQASFDKLKQAMISATHLSAIDPRQPYHLYTDALKDNVRMEGTRDIFDILPSCHGKCSLPKLDTRFENRSCWPSY